MTPSTKAQLIEQFSAYLDSTDLPEQDSVAPPQDGEQIDLFSLFVELAALRSEVKIESRQVKTALEEFRTVFTTLQTSHQQLGTELERNRVAQNGLQRATLRPLLLELLDLHDRLEAGLQSLHDLPAPRLAWLKKREISLINSVREGQQISLRRLQYILQSHGVSAFNTLGAALNPQLARVVEVIHKPELDNGVVVEELRKGFHWDDELLRPAEVKVNKHEA